MHAVDDRASSSCARAAADGADGGWRKRLYPRDHLGDMATGRQPPTHARDVPSASVFVDVPGWELVGKGLADLRADRLSVEALLVASAADRLGGLGIDVPVSAVGVAADRLYRLVEAEVGEAAAHGRYNALRRRLASFLRSARHAAPR